jgi:hypothetical protein
MAPWRRLRRLEERLRGHLTRAQCHALFTTLCTLVEQALATAGIPAAQRQAIAAQITAAWQAEAGILPRLVAAPQAAGVVHHLALTIITVVRAAGVDEGRCRTIFAHIAAGIAARLYE